MNSVAISGSGLFTPEASISNEELVAAFNQHVERRNGECAEAIAAGEAAALTPSNADFIVKASGIHSRYVVDKAGILDPARMRPSIRTRARDEPTLMVEMGAKAARQALAAARRGADEIDLVVVACSNPQRAYPAIAVELQAELGSHGYAYDMNVACASAAFGIQTAAQAVAAGTARAALVISPEICSGHLDFTDRDSHFIFGDAATAVVIEPVAAANGDAVFEILGSRLKTSFSNNIRNDAGFLNRSEEPPRAPHELLFRQEGRKVFKDVVPFAAELIAGELAALGLAASDLKRLWLHQANLNMNQLIARRLLGHDANEREAPVILDRYANTSSAGSVIAFHLHHADLLPGDLAVLCAFGAGYSAGCIVMRRC